MALRELGPEAWLLAGDGLRSLVPAGAPVPGAWGTEVLGTEVGLPGFSSCRQGCPGVAAAQPSDLPPLPPAPLAPPPALPGPAC